MTREETLFDRLVESTAILEALRIKLRGFVNPAVIGDITAVIDKNDTVIEASFDKFDPYRPSSARGAT